jgi:ectoine hydroxylase-related dioxygenase (phytanoyl-CoA dioxygenase family)
MNSNYQKLLSDIETKGYTVIPNFISEERLNKFMPEVHRRFSRQSYNGTVGYVEYSQQKYLQWTLTVHEEILKAYLDPDIIRAAELYAGQDVQLQDYRIYQNNPGLNMAWHVDNKLTMHDGSSKMVESKGLILIVYLEDVKAGPFQFVEGSHAWAWKENKEVWDEEVEKNKDLKVVTFDRLPRGTAILYDFRGIHRAQPFLDGPPRTSLFAQYSGLEWPAGEPIFLESGTLKNLTAKEMQVLRFGRPPAAKTWPIPADAVQVLGSPPQPVKLFDQIKRKTKQLWT